VKDKDVLLVDDLTETAGTLTSAAELLKREGAKKVFACVSHALLNDIGIQRLRNSEITELITTDSVPNQPVEGINLKVISVASLLGEAIVRIHKNLSVTSLFN
jgi:ribose-phosphate pyrophosphokinase